MRACAIILVLSGASHAAVGEAPVLTYEQHIRPLFRKHCFDCHGATEELKGSLDLRLVRFMARGGDSGPAIVPGEANQSYLLERVRAGEMPPGEAKLSPQEVVTIERWIASGAKTARAEPDTIGPGLGITPEERAFWSFQPIRRPDVPEFPGDSRVRTPIDALLRAEMKPRGLGFSADADRRTLMLRAYFDLTGLPPTKEQSQEFLSDDSPDAYARLVDELLSSPHYGERWGRHWLDIAGYADSEGATTADAERGWAWKYRDYVVRSFNDDKPFDRFLVEQVAGDELAGPIEGELTSEQVELLTATGFLRMAADGTGSGAGTPEGRNQVIADTIKIVSTSLLGMSVACAQCHDHRYDPIPQTDYYALRAILEPALDWQNWKTPAQRLVSLYTAEDRAKAALIEAEVQKISGVRSEKLAQFMAEALEQELTKYDDSLREQLRTAYQADRADRSAQQTELLKQYPSVNIRPGVLYQYNQAAADELKEYDSRINELRATKPVEEFVRAVVEPPGHVPVTKLFHRGDHRQPTRDVAPAALTVTAPVGRQEVFARDDPALPTTGRRLAFAQWLTSGRHPLVARVLVNRIWLHHFGRGLVDTPADFGRLGTPPSHPELLDWLADEFMAGGWSVHHLHRVIMNSTAYRQTSLRTGEFDAIDPETRSYWRKPIMRLDAEIVRDRMLAAAGELDRTLFGGPLPVKEDDVGQVIIGDSRQRRSLYIQQRRSRPVALMKAFDAPVMETNCDRRSSSTVATQSLMLMNGKFVLARAAALAQRARDDAAAADLAQQVSRAWVLAYCRPPTAQELVIAMRYLIRQRTTIEQGDIELPDGVTPEQQALTNLCQVLLTSNEFLYVD